MTNITEVTPAVGGGGDKGRNNEMKRLPIFVTLSLFVLLMVVVVTSLIIREYNHETKTALDRREALATLGALLIHEKFDGIIDIGISIASRAMVCQNIEKGDWSKSIEGLRNLPQVFPYIDSVALFDKEGVLKAIIPPAPEVTGKSFDYRDYYKGVSKEWKPYVSEAFKRAVEPKYNLVSVAVPIKSSDQKVLGILLLSVKLNTIMSWGEEISLGSDGYIYVVDKKGQLVAHPKLKEDEGLVDFSAVPATQRVLGGESGVGIFFDSVDNEEDLVAYAPVQDYGFGVMVVQPTDTAFSERKKQLIEFIIFWVLIVFATTSFLYRILKDRVALKAQRDHEATLLESIGDGVVAIDRNWNITLWNKAASAITGWSKEEALGKPLRTILKFIRERDHAENVLFIEDAMGREEITSMSDGTILIRKDGKEIPVGDSAAPIFCKGDTLDGVIVIFRDISLALEKSHLRSDIAYAAHQFRTPITEALWNLEIGMKEEDSGKRREDLRTVYQSLLSVRKLSEHLVFVSEVDQGNIAVKSSEVIIHDVLVEVKSKIEDEAKLRGIMLFFSSVPPLVMVNTDKKLLSRALFEIIENAVIYSHRDSRVEVTTSLEEKELLIEVADTGFGITEEEQPIIFTKFFRGSNRGSGNAGGGLGLYLAKAYITLLGGKIWFNSEEDKGTTFFVSLPIT